MTCRIPLYVISVLIFASGCTGLKQTASPARNSSSSSPKVVNKNPKFLEDISINPESSSSQVAIGAPQKQPDKSYNYYPSSSNVENASALQLKYALLLNTEVEEVQNMRMYQFIDDWYGTRYCLGGTTKTCIDCSGFVQTFFSAVFGLTIPRTAKDQYSSVDKISSRRLKQGDLLFFNTRGGVSHVGVYLTNNKFVHASTSNGVMISDLSEEYYDRRFIGAGRLEMQIEVTGKR